MKAKPTRNTLYFSSEDLIQFIADLPMTEDERLMLVHKMFLLPEGITRCKDCKWFNQFGCAIGVVDDTDKPNEYDYCSFAEPKAP